MFATSALVVALALAGVPKGEAASAKTETAPAKAEALEVDALGEAGEFYRHGLLDRAAETFIGVLYAPKAPDNSRAEALYWLGVISAEKQRLSTAMEDWGRLVERYPNSPRAAEVKDRMQALTGGLQKEVATATDNAVAEVWLRNGDFWSHGDRVYHLDSSWLPDSTMSHEWYDRVIKEFPGTPAAESAFERKILVYAGGYTDKFEVNRVVKGDANSAAKTLREMAAAFPKSTKLQALGYIVAQAYWVSGQKNDTKIWLNWVIDAGGKSENFYTRLARFRLIHQGPSGQ